MPNNNPYNHCLLLAYHQQVLAVSFSGHMRCSVCFEFSHSFATSFSGLVNVRTRHSLDKPVSTQCRSTLYLFVNMPLFFSQFCCLYPHVDVVYWQPICQGAGGCKCHLSFFHMFKPAVYRLSVSKQRTIPSMHWKKVL